MRQKFYGWFVKRFFPYWCNYCPRRYRTEQKFHEHFLVCENRKAFMIERERVRDDAIEAIAPVNRKERRQMAKRSGQIKDWKKLNV